MGRETTGRAPRDDPPSTTKGLGDPSFDPFRRTDVLGAWGAERPPPLHMRLSLLLVMPIKLSLGIACMLWSLLFLSLLPAAVARFLVKGLAHTCLFFLGFGALRVVRVGGEAEEGPTPAFYVSNHTSWLDIIVIIAMICPGFVAKAATQHISIVGRCSDALGCIYVEREGSNAGKGKVSAQLKARAEAMASDPDHTKRVVIFPEGTTTNGRYLLPFKTGAFVAGAPVQALVIRYGEREGNVSCAYESIKGLWHLILVAAQRNSVTVYVPPVYVPNAEEVADAKLYANNVRAVMARVGDWLELSDAGLPEKREYQRLYDETRKSFKKVD